MSYFVHHLIRPTPQIVRASLSFLSNALVSNGGSSSRLEVLVATNLCCILASRCGQVARASLVRDPTDLIKVRLASLKNTHIARSPPCKNYREISSTVSHRIQSGTDLLPAHRVLGHQREPRPTRRALSHLALPQLNGTQAVKATVFIILLSRTAANRSCSSSQTLAPSCPTELFCC